MLILLLVRWRKDHATTSTLRLGWESHFQLQWKMWWSNSNLPCCCLASLSLLSYRHCAHHTVVFLLILCWWHCVDHVVVFQKLCCWSYCWCPAGLFSRRQSPLLLLPPSLVLCVSSDISCKRGQIGSDPLTKGNPKQWLPSPCDGCQCSQLGLGLAQVPFLHLIF